jgi:pilus assembly protein TadC
MKISKLRFTKLITIIITISFILLFFTPYTTAQNDSSPPQIKIISPKEGSIIKDQNPTIKAEYFDPSGINKGSVKLYLDNNEVSDWDETEISEKSISFTPPDVYKLNEGNHTVRLIVSDVNDNFAEKTWIFTINLTSEEESEQFVLNAIQILFYVMLFSVIGVMVFFINIYYLMKTKGWSFRKYFARHPVSKQYLVILLPFTIAFFIFILGINVVNINPQASTFDPEYVIVLAILVGIFPLAIDSILENRLINKYERAFSQFLFELAAAMRGGLDPAKSILELAKTDTSVIKNHLRIAADNIKIGRPFDEILKNMVKPMKSELISRYASIIAESSKVGGETSQVIHRAAKDMDDFIKISRERKRELFMQSTTIYIAFFVTLICIQQLVIIFPSLSASNLGSFFGVTNLEEATQTQQVSKMTFITLKRRFFHLMLINSIGSGILIGKFVDGKAKYGMVHLIVLTIATTIFFILFIINVH